MDFLHNANIDLEPYAYQEWLRKEGYLNSGENWESRNVYRNAQRTKVINPSTGEEEWQNSGKWNDPKLKSEFYNMYNNSVGKLPEPERRDLLEKGKDWFLSNLTSTGDAYKNSGQYRNDASGSYVPYNQNPASGLKHDYKKAFGGFKYPNGGSFYDSSNINTSKPQVNKDGTTTTTPNPTGGNSSNTMSYIGAGIGAAGNIINTWTQPSNLTTQGKIENTAQGVGDTVAGFIPGVSYATEASNLGRGLITSGKPTVVNSNTGKTEPVLNTGEALLDTTLTPQHTNDISAWTNIFSGKADGYDYVSALAGGTVGGWVKDIGESGKNQDQYNKEYMANANWSKDQGARNFSAFGGYKNKFPYGGHVNTFNLAQMAYGGNMQSEVTGQSYLKDQVVNFDKPGFKEHKDGGVNVDSSNQVEKKEVMWKTKDGNSYIFSERLKNKDGVSYAEIGRKLLKQIGK